jgi:DNA-directed RNA polymerase specialized sigma24 family protein
MRILGICLDQAKANLRLAASVAAWRSLDQYQNPRPFEAWLRRIALNKATHGIGGKHE